jgi:hypothetical protein
MAKNLNSGAGVIRTLVALGLVANVLALWVNETRIELGEKNREVLLLGAGGVAALVVTDRGFPEQNAALLLDCKPLGFSSWAGAFGNADGRTGSFRGESIAVPVGRGTECK